ncbi:hypothetical protein KM176_12380 [Pseudooceanicola sp. CBS1P-1]|uniref:Uncharacterized protein n=1 Tax=Pseudooceanicola albus TaxID=2692189 RepID=A0A6L7G2Z3_9RHOB|nr:MULTISPECIES: hypothetical protein [Pseudooceanicola]MBT9384660.1 hypothetical protein [Pseudooceanicola endophyticus]MXN18361.1 hypothetical protein [Pseudooceanicola albus]
MILLHASHTHLYPGARGRIDGTGDGAAMVHFADGAQAPAQLGPDTLHVAAHRTLAGTVIAAQRWRIRREGAGFRVLGHQLPV